MNESAMLSNLELTHGALFSQRVLGADGSGHGARRGLPGRSGARPASVRRGHPPARAARRRPQGERTGPRFDLRGLRSLRALLRGDSRARQGLLTVSIRSAERPAPPGRTRGRAASSAGRLPAGLVASIAPRRALFADLPDHQWEGASSSTARPAEDAPESCLLMVASDRISTYDAVHPTPIPNKGKVLTGVSVFWFAKTAHIVANHLVSRPRSERERERVRERERPVHGRALLVSRLQMLPIECVVPRLHHRLRLEGLPGDGRRFRDRVAKWIAQSPSSCPSRSSPPRRRPRRVTTRRST